LRCGSCVRRGCPPVRCVDQWADVCWQRNPRRDQCQCPAQQCWSTASTWDTVRLTPRASSPRVQVVGGICCQLDRRWRLYATLFHMYVCFRHLLCTVLYCGTLLVHNSTRCNTAVPDKGLVPHTGRADLVTSQPTVPRLLRVIVISSHVYRAPTSAES
jgi:hypothetical protein